MYAFRTKTSGMQYLKKINYDFSLLLSIYTEILKLMYCSIWITTHQRSCTSGGDMFFSCGMGRCSCYECVVVAIMSFKVVLKHKQQRHNQLRPTDNSTQCYPSMQQPNLLAFRHGLQLSALHLENRRAAFLQVV